MKTLLPLGALAGGLGLLAAGLAAQTRSVQVFIKVVDSIGSPVLDLEPEDFEITEGGERRPIVRAAPAGAPMRIALLVDNSDPAGRALNDIRGGLRAFLEALPEPHEILLITTGRQLRVHVQATTDRARLQRSAAAIFADAGSGTVLLDALLETFRRFLRQDDVRWPVFVVLTADGAESSQGVRENEYARFVREIGARAATVHAVVLSMRGQAGSAIQAEVARDLSQLTGGHYEALAASTVLPDRMSALGALILEQHAAISDWYQVEYTTSAGPDEQPSTLVGVAGRGLRFDVSPRRPVGGR
jgi:hypothetical protein